MTLPILLFQSGTHGNFLARCLSVASGKTKDFDFYGGLKGAHNQYNKFKKIVEHVHEYDQTNVFIYINFNPSDLYILHWHLFFAAGDFGLDLLTVKNFDEIISLINHKSAHPMVVDSLSHQVSIFKDNGIVGLREMFKLVFSESHGLLTEQSEILAKHKINNMFEFSWFYDQEIFCKKVKDLLETLGYNYETDILHHQQQFLDRKQGILQSKKLVELAYQCYTTNTSMDISKLCIYEQGYLDYLIQQYLGYEIENWQEGYPKNTKDIKPVKVWEGKKYDI